MSAVLEYENVTKEYAVPFSGRRRVLALQDFSLTVEQGEIFGFLGRTGPARARPSTLPWGLCVQAVDAGAC